MAAYPLFTDQDQVIPNQARFMQGSVQRSPSAISNAFFSNQNLQFIQNELRRTLFEKTGYKVVEQSPEAVLTHMRNQFLLNGPYAPEDVPAELARLNTAVLSIIVPQAATALSQYLGYLRDASTLAPPLERGENTSVRGRNSLQMFTNGV